HIELYDHKSKPKPHVIKGQGMVVQLATEEKPGAEPRATPAARLGARKQQRDNITGVKWIELHKGVTMTFYTEGKSGFLAGGEAKTGPSPGPAASGADVPSKPAATADARKPERSEL